MFYYKQTPDIRSRATIDMFGVDGVISFINTENPGINIVGSDLPPHGPTLAARHLWGRERCAHPLPMVTLHASLCVEDQSFPSPFKKVCPMEVVLEHSSTL